MPITLLGRSSSANVQKVRWVLAELGLVHEHIELGGRFGGNRTPEFLAFNPNGLVPTLRDDGLVLWESHAILRYLSAQYGSGSLWPERPAARAECDRWTDWTATTFQPAWLGTFWAWYRTPPHERTESLLKLKVAAAESCFEILDARLANARFLAGDSLTYADLAAGVAMFRWRTMGMERRLHPNVERWADDLQMRQSYRDMVAIDFSELMGRTTP